MRLQVGSGDALVRERVRQPQPSTRGDQVQRDDDERDAAHGRDARRHRQAARQRENQQREAERPVPQPRQDLAKCDALARPLPRARAGPRTCAREWGVAVSVLGAPREYQHPLRREFLVGGLGRPGILMDVQRQESPAFSQATAASSAASAAASAPLALPGRYWARPEESAPRLRGRLHRSSRPPSARARRHRSTQTFDCRRSGPASVRRTSASPPAAQRHGQHLRGAGRRGADAAGDRCGRSHTIRRAHAQLRVVAETRLDRPDTRRRRAGRRGRRKPRAPRRRAAAPSPPASARGCRRCSAASRRPSRKLLPRHTA